MQEASLEAVESLPVESETKEDTMSIGTALQMGKSLLVEFESTDDEALVTRALQVLEAGIRAGNPDEFPDPKLLVELARGFRYHGSYEGALQICANVIQEAPSFPGLQEVVFESVMNMIHLRMQLPSDYVSAASTFPVSHIDINVDLEDHFAMLCARSHSIRGNMEIAEAGYQEVFQRCRLKGNSVVGSHLRWEEWVSDPSTWSYFAKPFLAARQTLEAAHALLLGAIDCAAALQDESLEALALTYSQLDVGSRDRAKIYVRRIRRGHFLRDWVGSRRRYPKWARVCMRKEVEARSRRLARSRYLDAWIDDQALTADRRAREEDENRMMRKAEDEMRFYLTELKICRAITLIQRVCRGFMVRGLLIPNIRRGVIKIQACLRGSFARTRVARIRALRKILTMRVHCRLVHAYRRRVALWRLAKLVASWEGARCAQRLIAQRRLFYTANAFVHCLRLQRRLKEEIRRRAMWKLRSTIAVSSAARCVQRSIVRGTAIRGAKKVVTVSVACICVLKMKKRIEWYKEDAAARMLQRAVRRKMMQDLFKCLSNFHARPSRILDLYFRGKLSAELVIIVEARLHTHALKIQAHARRVKANKRASLLRIERERAIRRERQRQERLARRRRAIEQQRAAAEQRRKAKIRSRRREISKALLNQLRNPTYETLTNILTDARIALGSESEMVLKGEKLLRALEKESAHQHFWRSRERRRVHVRAQDRRFGGIDRELDEAFRRGDLQIRQAPQPESDAVVEAQ